MREIKFRAWDKAANRWMKSEFITDLLAIGVPDDPREGVFNIHDYATNRYEIMQYTGLKDKNGVEIYEGDVLKQGLTRAKRVVATDTVVVEWGATAGDDDGLAYGWNLLDNGHHEVIGNIYENPELVQKGESE